MRKFKNIYEGILHQQTTYPVPKMSIDSSAFGVSPEASDILVRIESISMLKPSESITSARSLVTEIMNLKDPTEKKWLIWHLNTTLPDAPLRSNYVRNYIESVNEGSMDSIKSWVNSLDLKPKYDKFEQALDLISSILRLISDVKDVFSSSSMLGRRYKQLFDIEEDAMEMENELRQRVTRRHKEESRVEESVDYKQIFSVLKTVFSIILLVMQLTRIVKGTIELRKIFGTRVSRMYHNADSLHKELSDYNGETIEVTDYKVKT